MNRNENRQHHALSLGVDHNELDELPSANVGSKVEAVYERW